ncbi:hypothetical protein K439DRAFT_1643377 [Ramaria rubella]|nr:hypothetical protein K439DRAFT_1643377 [Ramaria rubella]
MEGKAKKPRVQMGEYQTEILWLRDGAYPGSVARISMQVFDQRYEWRNNKEAREKTR